MNVLLDRCMRRSNLVHELYESWQLDHQEARYAADVEELCGEAVDLCRLCRHVWQTLWDELFKLLIYNPITTGLSFQKIIDRSTEVAASINGEAIKATNKGHKFAGAEQLADCVRDMEALKKEIADKWPFMNDDPDMAAESRAAILRGEYMTIEELLHAVQTRGLDAVNQENWPIKPPPHVVGQSPRVSA